MNNSKIQKRIDFGGISKAKSEVKNSKRLPDFYIGFAVCSHEFTDSCLKNLYFISGLQPHLAKYS
jgi:hypothetical protein